MLAPLDDDYDEADMAALRLAFERCMARPNRAEQLRAKLEDDRWHEVAKFAAYVEQIDALRLKPWAEPPCVADEDDPAERDREAQRLLRKMLRYGVSRYDPDPLRAIAAAKQRRAKAKTNRVTADE